MVNLKELEWKLVQVNLMVDEEGWFVEFEKKSDLFTVDVLINEQLLELPTKLVRRYLVGIIELVSATLEYQFVLFDVADGKDLRVFLMLPDGSSRIFAKYENKEFSFTQHYWNYRKEQNFDN